MTTDISCASETPDSVPPLGVIGRIGRFSFGLFQLYFVAVMVGNGGALLTTESPPTDPGLWIGFVLAFVLLPWTVNLAFRKTWGRRPLYLALTAVALSATISLALGEGVWGPALGGVVLSVSLYVHGHMGLCHVLSALLATRGCEMRSIPHLFAILSGNDVALVTCPGAWGPIDRWEAKLFGKSGMKSDA